MKIINPLLPTFILGEKWVMSKQIGLSFMCALTNQKTALLFVTYPNDNSGALHGAHDDLVIADAIAAMMRVMPKKQISAEYRTLVKVGDFKLLSFGETIAA